MASKAQLKAQAKYDEKHTKQIHLKLNIETDRDILEFLKKSGNVQGTIKTAIREMMQKG